MAQPRRRRCVVAIAPLWLIALLLALAGRIASAQAAPSPVEIAADDSPITLRAHVRALFETDRPLDPETVARNSDAGKPHPMSPPNYGRYNKPVWGYLAVVNKTPRQEWILVYSLSTVEDVRVFVRKQGEASFRALRELGYDARLPFSGFRSATYSLTLDKDVPVEIVTRVVTRAPIGFHLQLWKPDVFFESDRQQIGVTGLAFAAPLVVFIYLLILTTVLRQRGLISLMVLLFSKLVVDAWISGLASVIMPAIPRAVWPVLGFLSVTILIVASVLHVRRFLNLPQSSPRGDRALLLFCAIGVILAITELSGVANVRLLIQLYAPIGFAWFAVLSTRQAWATPNVGNISYALAWTMFLSQAVIQFLRLIVIVPFSEELTIFAQSAIASLLFGVAIFTRIRDQDRERNRSLAETNERLGLVIDGSAAAIYEYAFRDGSFWFAPRLNEMISLRAGAGLRGVLRSLRPAARRELLDAIKKALSERSRHFRIEILPDNSDRELQVLAVTGAIQYRRDDAAPERICGSVIDVTSEKNLRIEQTLRSLVLEEKQLIERSLQARTAFYAAANHDLRHPLLSLGLYLEMLSRTPGKLGAFLPRMLDAHRSASLYLDRIVAMARVDARVELAERRTESLHSILSRLVERYQADALRKNLKLRYVATSLSAMTDAFLLERLLSNVLSNAIQNTDRGGVLVGCRRLHHGVRIDVIDTGPGLPRAVQEQLTDGEVEKHAEVSGSLRLGLAIVKRTANELGCVLNASSQPGRGTRISVVFAASPSVELAGRTMQTA